MHATFPSSPEVLIFGKYIAWIRTWNVCKPCDAKRAWRCPQFLMVGNRQKLSKMAFHVYLLWLNLYLHLLYSSSTSYPTPTISSLSLCCLSLGSCSPHNSTMTGASVPSRLCCRQLEHCSGLRGRKKIQQVSISVRQWHGIIDVWEGALQWGTFS